jgi:hypothetical protein
LSTKYFSSYHKYHMRKWIDAITESYLTALKFGTSTAEVFENPSRKEVSQMLVRGEFGILRGLLNHEGSLLVWSAEEIEHQDIENKLLRGMNADFRLFLHRDKVVVYEDDLTFLNERGVDGLGALKAHPSIVRLYGRNPTVEVD